MAFSTINGFEFSKPRAQQKKTFVAIPSLPSLFKNYFKDPSWWLWNVVLKASFGDVSEIDEEEGAALYSVIERGTVPDDLRELWVVIGRRGGKDAIMAFVALYLACARNWNKEFHSGETIVGMIICPDRKQGRIALNYMRSYCEQVPEFGRLVRGVLKESISFRNGISIEIHTANFRSVRGYTIPFAILSEIAFFASEDSANPDSEIINAIRPAMATVSNPLLMAISSPYARTGELYKTFRNHYGKDDNSILVVKGPTQAFNPSIDAKIVEHAFEEDPVSAASEYGSLDNGIHFRTDVEGYASLESIQACVAIGRRELAPGPENYFGFVDPSGGSVDSYTAAVAHREADGTLVLDATREMKPPFSPEAATEALAKFFLSYRIRRIQGDHYAGEWPREQFRKHGIEYQISERNKSAIYAEALPLINSARARLLDDPRLIAQISGLERRTARSGKDSIDHPPGGHDDLANAALGAVLTCCTTFVRTADDPGWS